MAIVLVAATFGCSHEAQRDYAPVIGPQPAAPEVLQHYEFGVRPLGNSRDLWSKWVGLVACVNRRVGAFSVRLSSAQREVNYEDWLRNGVFDFAVVEPHRVLELEKLGYSVIARTGAADRISGVLVVGASNTISNMRKLRGREVFFGSADALAATMLVKARLYEGGLNPERDLRCRYADNETSALMNVALGSAAAAGASREGWARFAEKFPAAAEKLDPRWTTIDLPGPAVMAHKRVPDEHRAAIRSALVGLASDAEGRAALGAAGVSEFRAGDASSYDAVWEFMLEYRRRIGRIPKGASNDRS